MQGSVGMPARPQTAAVRSTGLGIENLLADPSFDIQSAQDEIDKELAEMMQRN